MRQKIVRGDYRPGDVLPGVRELARQCGTSVRVPMAAVAALAAEGFVKPRPRIGCMVLGKDRRVWRGKVLIIRNAIVVSYSGIVFREELAAQFMRADWRVEFLSVSYGPDNETPDLKALKRMLTERIDLIVFMSNDERMVEIIDAAGIPYVTGCEQSTMTGNHVGRYMIPWRGVMVAFAEECGRRGVRRVLRVSIPGCTLDEQGDFRRNGVSVEDLTVTPARGERMLESFRQCAYGALSARLRKDGLPDLILFCDDYLACGGLLALAEAGLKAPDDVKVVTLANAGNVPVYARELARFEIDGRAGACKLARAAIKFLDTGVRPGNVMQPVTYVAGETF